MIRTLPDRVLRVFLTGLVQVYRYAISPMIGPRCRFHPTCSGYAIEALRLHGGTRGGVLAVKRILRCHPWGGAGEDPVPRPASPRRARAATPSRSPIGLDRDRPNR